MSSGGRVRWVGTNRVLLELGQEWRASGGWSRAVSLDDVLGVHRERKRGSSSRCQFQHRHRGGGPVFTISTNTLRQNIGQWNVPCIECRSLESLGARQFDLLLHRAKFLFGISVKPKLRIVEIDGEDEPALSTR